MKVNEMIKILCEFNPYAEVEINEDGLVYPLEFYAWRTNGGADSASSERDIEKEKYTAESVSFVRSGKQYGEH